MTGLSIQLGHDPSAAHSALPYYVLPPDHERGDVQAWAGYAIQFSGERRFEWQEDLLEELKLALAELAPGPSIGGTYMTTDPTKCDAENRLFTNPSGAFADGITTIRFERGRGSLPASPVRVSPFAGHLHYYRYRSSSGFEWWEPDELLATWTRVPRSLRGDDTARPSWLALKRAAAQGRVQVLSHGEFDDIPFGIRVSVHATRQGPYSAPACSENFVDGAIAAFHAPPPNAGLVADRLAPKLRGTSPAELEQLLSLRWLGNLFQASAFRVASHGVQISPCDERCLAGEVTIAPDASRDVVEFTGELFTLRPRSDRPRPHTRRRLGSTNV